MTILHYDEFPETFNEWCTSRKIVAYKQPFYHHLRTVLTFEEMGNLTPEDWDKQWDEVFFPEVIKSFMA